jgi:hypothetical protein
VSGQLHAPTALLQEKVSYINIGNKSQNQKRNENKHERKEKIKTGRRKQRQREKQKERNHAKEERNTKEKKRKTYDLHVFQFCLPNFLSLKGRNSEKLRYHHADGC